MSSLLISKMFIFLRLLLSYIFSLQCLYFYSSFSSAPHLCYVLTFFKFFRLFKLFSHQGLRKFRFLVMYSPLLFYLSTVVFRFSSIYLLSHAYHQCFLNFFVDIACFVSVFMFLFVPLFWLIVYYISSGYGVSLIKGFRNCKCSSYIYVL